MFKQNEGTTDRMIRGFVGALALVVGFFFLSGPLQIVAYVLGAVALVTGIVGFCGLYSLLGINTCPIEKPKAEPSQPAPSMDQTPVQPTN